MIRYDFESDDVEKIEKIISFLSGEERKGLSLKKQRLAIDGYQEHVSDDVRPLFKNLAREVLQLSFRFHSPHREKLIEISELARDSHLEPDAASPGGVQGGRWAALWVEAQCEKDNDRPPRSAAGKLAWLIADQFCEDATPSLGTVCLYVAQVARNAALEAGAPWAAIDAIEAAEFEAAAGIVRAGLAKALIGTGEEELSLTVA